MNRTAAFYCSGGDLIARPATRLTTADAEALLALYEDEIIAANHAGDASAQALARRLTDDLTQALRTTALWRQASGEVRS